MEKIRRGSVSESYMVIRLNSLGFRMSHMVTSKQNPKEVRRWGFFWKSGGKEFQPKDR